MVILCLFSPAGSGAEAGPFKVCLGWLFLWLPFLSLCGASFPANEANRQKPCGSEKCGRERQRETQRERMTLLSPLDLVVPYVHHRLSQFWESRWDQQPTSLDLGAWFDWSEKQNWSTHKTRTFIKEIPHCILQVFQPCYILREPHPPLIHFHFAIGKPSSPHMTYRENFIPKPGQSQIGSLHVIQVLPIAYLGSSAIATWDINTRRDLCPAVPFYG